MAQLTIWKYSLDWPDVTLKLPLGARILTAQIQGDRPVIWALVMPEMELRPRRLLCMTTGESVEDRSPTPGDLKYIATVTATTGVVWHVFEAPA